MKTTALLTQLATRGIRLVASPDGNRLGVQPAGALPPDLRQAVLDHKAGLLAMLRGECLTFRNPFSDPTPLAFCDRCGSDQHVDIVIHRGQSTRRDCLKCNKFLGFPQWHGRSML